MEEKVAWIQEQLAWLWTDLKELGSALIKEHQVLLIQILIGLILLFILAKLIKKISYKFKNQDKQIFYRKERILTRNELRFFKVLQQAAEEKDLCIFPMLRVSELLRVKKQSSRKKYYKYLNQISRKHVDFTLCRQDTNEIVCCIELQDRARTKELKEKRDQFISELFHDAGIFLVRVKSSSEGYEVDVIREQVEKAMEQNQVYLTRIREDEAGRKKVQPGGVKKRRKKRVPKREQKSPVQEPVYREENHAKTSEIKEEKNL